MYTCSNCDRAIGFMNLRCAVCRTYNLRVPHILLAGVLCFLVAGGVLGIIDHLAAVSDQQVVDKSIYQVPQPTPDLRNRQRVRGTSIGRP